MEHVDKSNFCQIQSEERQQNIFTKKLHWWIILDSY